MNTQLPPLKQAEEALIQQAEVAKLSRPSNRALKYFRRWLSGESRKQGSTAVLAGEANKMLEDQDDLAALKVPEDDDRLAQLMRDYWPLSVSPR